MNVGRRSLSFRDKQHNRYWWYKLNDTDYVPPIFDYLTEDEWAIMEAWFDDTEIKFPSPGEVSIPGISYLFGLIGGNGVNSMVQCGHYVGYSTLLVGFLFRRMGKKNALFSIDIDEAITNYTQEWVDRAGLNEHVKLVVASSSDPRMPDAAAAYFGRAPQIVFIDSSHQYQHTLEELDLWWPRLAPGGLVVMHDVSVFAGGFDSTAKGGVLSAVRDWAQQHAQTPLLLNSFVDGAVSPNELVYRDGCGIGLLQKSMVGS